LTQQEATTVSDDFSVPQAGASPPAVEMPEKRPGLLSSTGGKIVAILIGLGVLAVIAGLVAGAFLLFFGQSELDKFQDEVVVQQQESTSTAAPSTTATSGVVAAAGPAEQVLNKAIFTFRDIFEPLIKEEPEPTEPTDGSTTDTETPTTEGTLYLNDIVTEDGELKAQLRLNGTTYTLGEGESIPGTPWQVLRVTSTQVTMLYGDTQVTLTIGQGITK
jgi:type IV pilus biogenesis protein PilP